jgi:ParB family transcriptional regulator, chromosome partitioning protein
MQIHNIKLSDLTLSDLNVRKTERDADISSLAADIEQRGLKQNLVVMERDSPTDGAGEAVYEVIAGGRRFQAMKLLVDQGIFTDDTTIPCMIEGEDGAVETSLSENLHRVAMNPADEFLAFKTIIDAADGDDAARIAYCAKRFGVTEAHVRGRLRLSGLSEIVLDALRTGAITLGAAIAYASVDDSELQANVFEKQSKSQWKPHDPDSVRSAMKEKTYAPDHSSVLYIGLENYVKRGGRIDTDLFTLDHPQVLRDTKLVDDMVIEKFNREAKKLAVKHGFEAAMLVKRSYDQAKVEGYEPRFYNSKSANDETKNRIGLFSIDTTGKLMLGQYVLVAVENADGDEGPAFEVVDYEARRANEQRARHILLEQVRLATSIAHDGNFENRIFLPKALSWIRLNESEDGQECYFEVNLRLTKAELDAHIDQATAAYDQALIDKAAHDALVEEARVLLQKAREALKVEALANPPAVIETTHWPHYFIRWANGGYWSLSEAQFQEADDRHNMQGCDTLEELIEHAQVKGLWTSVEAYEAAIAAEIDGDDDDQSDAT